MRAVGRGSEGVVEFGAYLPGPFSAPIPWLANTNQLFQLRSIEQNELAIMADNQNKAIFVFTAVTIVFLPLSFFTSYFGMNLKGIMDTDRTEAGFWRMCGTISFCIVLLVVLWSFRYRIVKRLSPLHRMSRG